MFFEYIKYCSGLLIVFLLFSGVYNITTNMMGDAC